MVSSIIFAVASLPFVLSLLFSNVIVLVDATSSQNDVVSTICQRTRNPPFYSNVLESAGTTNLKGLATFTLNLACTKAIESQALAQSLALNAADLKLKERYASCAEHYSDAIGDINDANNYLAIGDYNGVNIQASGAMTNVGDCQDNLMLLPGNTLGLSENSKALEDICSIILVIANLLLRRV